MENLEIQAKEIINNLDQKGIEGIKRKRKEFESGSEDNKYRIWVELKVANKLFKKKYSIEILRGKAPDIKVNDNGSLYIEIKSFGKDDFRDEKIEKDLRSYLNNNYPEWKNLNFQVLIKYNIGSKSIINEKRKLTIPLFDRNLENDLYKDIKEALGKKEEKDKRPEFYCYKFDIIYFDNFQVQPNRKIFIINNYSGDWEDWLFNKIKILLDESNKKFEIDNFNILFIYYPHIVRDYIDKTIWEIISSNIWKDEKNKKCYDAIILSDFNNLFIKTDAENDKKIRSLFE